jgi:hypothetical protein
MSPAMIGFFFGVIVGGLGAIFLIGLLFLICHRENQKEEIHKAGSGPPLHPDAKLKPIGSLAGLAWGALRCTSNSFVPRVRKDFQA